MTLKSNVLFVLLLILVKSNLYCQSIVIDVQSSGGGYYSTPFAKVQFNIGEVVTDYYDLNSCIVNCGFEQVFKSVSNVGLKDQLNFNENISLFPNPTKGEVTIAFSQEIKQNLSIEIFDLFGKRLSGFALNQERVFDISEFPDGFYFVSLIIDNLPSNEKYKIIKID